MITRKLTTNTGQEIIIATDNAIGTMTIGFGNQTIISDEVISDTIEESTSDMNIQPSPEENK